MFVFLNCRCHDFWFTCELDWGNLGKKEASWEGGYFFQATLGRISEYSDWLLKHVIRDGFTGVWSYTVTQGPHFQRTLYWVGYSALAIWKILMTLNRELYSSILCEFLHMIPYSSGYAQILIFLVLSENRILHTQPLVLIKIHKTAFVGFGWRLCGLSAPLNMLKSISGLTPCFQCLELMIFCSRCPPQPPLLYWIALWWRAFLLQDV